MLVTLPLPNQSFWGKDITTPASEPRRQFAPSVLSLSIASRIRLPHPRTSSPARAAVRTTERTSKAGSRSAAAIAEIAAALANGESVADAMPAAAPFFNKASIESGPGVHMALRDIATETARMALAELGLSEKDVPKLKEVPAQKLLEVQESLAKKSAMGLSLSAGRKGMVVSRPGGFTPVVDGTYLPHHPFDPTAPEFSRDKPLMVGSNKDEMAFFLLERKDNEAFTLTEDRLKSRLSKELGENAERILATYRNNRPSASPAQLYVAITTARAFWLGSIEIAEKKSGQKAAPVYMYTFTHGSNMIVPGTNHRLGAAHATEIWYKFDNVDLETPKDAAGPTLIGDDSDRKKAALNMSQMWATFARTGHPEAKGQPSWPAYDRQTRATMMIDAECKVENDPFGLERAMWDSLKP